MSRSTLTPIYKVAFRPQAAKAFKKLDFALQQQLARKLDERRCNPHVPADRLHDLPHCYKIKLRASGIRAVYQVRDDALVLLVLAVGKRDRLEAYNFAAAELKNRDD
jgi:mRNA interferase RelE/StbE